MPNPTSALRRFWLALMFLTAGIATTSATSIRPPSFDQLVDGSGRIVRATVHSVRPYEDSFEGKRIVRTEIVLNVLETIRGETGPSEVTIRHLGGRIEGLAMEVGAMPKFEVGKEMVLFLHGEGRFICPTVGWGHGQYGVDRSGVDGVARIRRSDGRMLSSLKQVAEPMHEEEIRIQSVGPVATGMSLLNFTLSVRDRVENGKNQR
ncbi:MAG: hypothetical protein QNL51_02940 [Opitutaceae bacterium]|tara:strand:- start:696 stop:1313 length:618 start_codon:yes stop_codon:yes gene_type:complete